MPPTRPRLRRAAVASTVAAGLALLGLSVGGVAAMDSQLEVAARESLPSRLVEEASPGPAPDPRCRRGHPSTYQTAPEV